MTQQWIVGPLYWTVGDQPFFVWHVARRFSIPCCQQIGSCHASDYQCCHSEPEGLQLPAKSVAFEASIAILAVCCRELSENHI